MLVDFGSSLNDLNLPSGVQLYGCSLRVGCLGGGPEGLVSGLPGLVLASKVLIEPFSQPRYLRVGGAALVWLRLD